MSRTPSPRTSTSSSPPCRGCATAGAGCATRGTCSTSRPSSARSTGHDPRAAGGGRRAAPQPRLEDRRRRADAGARPAGHHPRPAWRGARRRRSAPAAAATSAAMLRIVPSTALPWSPRSRLPSCCDSSTLPGPRSTGATWSWAATAKSGPTSRSYAHGTVLKPKRMTWLAMPTWPPRHAWSATASTRFAIRSGEATGKGGRPTASPYVAACR